MLPSAAVRGWEEASLGLRCRLDDHVHDLLVWLISLTTTQMVFPAWRELICTCIMRCNLGAGVRHGGQKQQELFEYHIITTFTG